MPVISIITVVFNAQELLEETIKSVLGQSFDAIEYIIIDGQSTDNTISVIDKYKSQVSKFISEKDDGIYDAMNKGLQLATGDYILFLNAGDEFYDTNVLQEIFSSHSNADVYYGNTKVIDNAGLIIGNRRLTPPSELTWRSFQFGMSVSHQSIIIKRLLCTPYDLQYKISADIDWVIRCLKKADNIVNTKLYISKFLEGGTSNNSRSLALKERFIIMIKHYGFITTVWNHTFIMLRFIIQKATRKSMT